MSALADSPDPQTASGGPAGAGTATGRRDGARGRYAGIAALVLATALWGFGGTVASLLFDRGVDPIQLVEARTALTAAGLLVVLAIVAGRVRVRTGTRGRSRDDRGGGSQRPGAAWPLILVFGGSITLSNSALFIAIDHLPVAVAMVLQNLAPVFVAAWIMGTIRRRPTAGMAYGMLIALIGVILVVELPTTSIGQLNVVGIGFGLLTALGVAAFSVAGARATLRYGAVRANTYAFLVAALGWLVYQVPQGLPDSILPAAHLPGILAVGLLGTLAPFVLWSWGCSLAGAQAGAVIIALEPAFGTLIAWSWLGQRLTLLQILGGVVIIVGITVLQRAERHGAGRGD